MHLNKIISGAGLLALALTLGAMNTRAQDDNTPAPDAPPKPAARSFPVPLIDSGPDDNSSDLNSLQPDSTPLTGVQNPTLGSPAVRHSYWIPGIEYAGSGQSNGTVLTNSAGTPVPGNSWVGDNYIIGNISALKAWAHAQFTVNYSGGGFFSTDSTQGNGYYQQMALSQAFQYNRWTIQLLDQFSYLPQSQFGFGGGTALGVAGVGGPFSPVIPLLNNSFTPDQSIYGSQGPRYSNAAATQVTYAVSPRGSITATGSYGILSFTNAASVDNTTLTTSLGYNYQLSRQTTVGLVYRFSALHYPGEPQAFGNHVFAIAYSRKLTGRMSFNVNGGPQITDFRVPVNGSTHSIGANVIVGFNYAVRGGDFNANYLHGLSGGSGVFTGSTIDQLSFSASHKLGRIWTAQGNVGYSHNKTLVSASQATLPDFNSIYAGGGVSRPFGPDFNLAVAYTANITKTNQSGCVGTVCLANQTSNFITLTLQWHTRPFVIE